MGWRFVVTDQGGHAVGEPRAQDRSFTAGISTIRTAGFRIRDTDPLWNTISAGDSMLKVYDSNQTLQLYGPIVNDEEVADGQGSSVRFSAADLMWRLTKRFVGKDVNGVGNQYYQTDSGDIAFDVLNITNAQESTGIDVGTRNEFVDRTITHLWKRASDAINELGAISGSYEWELRYADGSPPIVSLDLKTSLGSDRTSSVFLEYGSGKRNCAHYGKRRTLDALATDVWVLGAGSTIAVLATNVGARERWKRHEDIVTYGDITVTSLLDALAAAHVAIRKQPRELVNLVPFPKLTPRYGVDYVVGDTITARVVIRGENRVSGTVRIWNTTISLDDLGNEVAAFSLEPQ